MLLILEMAWIDSFTQIICNFHQKTRTEIKTEVENAPLTGKVVFWYNNCGVLFPHSEASGIQPEGVCMGLYPGNGAGMVCSKTFQLLMRRKK